MGDGVRWVGKARPENARVGDEWDDGTTVRVLVWDDGSWGGTKWVAKRD